MSAGINRLLVEVPEMSLRNSLLSCVVALSVCAFADRFAPQAEPTGTIAFSVSDAQAPLSGSLTLSGLDHEGRRIVLEPRDGRIARVPAGLYSVEFAPGAPDARFASAALAPRVIAVAPERVTSLRVQTVLADASDARLAALETK
jgi:hypothetical protein